MDASLASAAVAVIAAWGTAEDFERHLEAREEAATPQEQLRYLYTLADFRHPELLERTLRMALTEDVRAQNVPGLLGRTIANREHGDLAWAFVKERWSDIERRIAPSTLVYVAEGIRFLMTPELVADAAAFFGEHPVPQSGMQLAQHLERQRMNAELRRRAADELAEAFAF